MKRADVAPAETGKEIFAGSPIDLNVRACGMVTCCFEQRDSTHRNNQRNAVVSFHLRIGLLGLSDTAPDRQRLIPRLRRKEEESYRQDYPDSTCERKLQSDSANSLIINLVTLVNPVYL